MDAKIETGGLKALANLAGANVDFSNEYSKTDYALELMYSRAFLENFIMENNIKPEIMAVKNWDKSQNILKTPYFCAVFFH